MKINKTSEILQNLKLLKVELPICLGFEFTRHFSKWQVNNIAKGDGSWY